MSIILERHMDNRRDRLRAACGTLAEDLHMLGRNFSWESLCSTRSARY